VAAGIGQAATGRLRPRSAVAAGRGRRRAASTLSHTASPPNSGPGGPVSSASSSPSSHAAKLRAPRSPSPLHPPDPASTASAPPQGWERGGPGTTCLLRWGREQGRSGAGMKERGGRVCGWRLKEIKEK
jgi:hypothetical protein